MRRIAQALLVLELLGLRSNSVPQVRIRQEHTLSSLQAPGFYRGTLGMFEVTALSDGIAPRRLDEIMSDPKVVQWELSADHESEPVAISINAYLINTGSHLVLVDTGAGDLFGSSSGLLMLTSRPAAIAQIRWT
jgi:hypothetical protein